MKQVTIYTDGACVPNPGSGGYAALLVSGEHEKVVKGNVQDTTNIRMEIYAVIKGLEALKQPCQVTVYSDCQMVVKCGNREWKRRANMDLWDEFNTVAAGHDVTLCWIRGHDGHPQNEIVDSLAYEMAEAYAA